MAQTYTYEALKAAAKQYKLRVTDLLALAPKNDPFYAGTPATVDRGRWFAEVYTAAGFSQFRPPHLRRVHYWTVSQDPPVIMPDGMPYTNTQGCWEFMIEASKAARYLGLVPLDGIVDNKNPTPLVQAVYSDENTPSVEIGIPDFDSPDIWINRPPASNAQPYHLELWCEKSTMNDVLRPVCDRYHANLVTFEGEVSITSVCVNLMRRLEEADKPARIFYISDFDPAGNSMPVAMSRKLEFMARHAVRDLEVKVNPLALTREQVETYQLPRIPIKETERRAGQFESAFGTGAVELDALEAIYPGTLAELAQAALKPYHSPAAEAEQRRQANALYAAVREQVDAITARYQDEIEAMQGMLAELREIEVNAAPYAVPTYPADVAEDDGWLYDSGRDYFDQIERYKAHKSGE